MMPKPTYNNFQEGKQKIVGFDMGFNWAISDFGIRNFLTVSRWDLKSRHLKRHDLPRRIMPRSQHC